MKNNLILLLILIMGFGIASCGKDDEQNDTGDPKLIHGIWDVTSIVYAASSACVNYPSGAEFEYSLIPCLNSTEPYCENLSYEFKSDGTVVSLLSQLNGYSTAEKIGSYTFDGTDLEICSFALGGCDAGTVSFNGDNATINDFYSELYGCTQTITMIKRQ